MIIEPETRYAISHVMNGLRAWNVKELIAALGPAYRTEFSLWVERRAVIRYQITHRDRAVAVFGFVGGNGLAPNEWDVYFQARDEFEPLAANSVRLLRRVLIRDTASHDIDFVRAAALAGNSKSPRWFEALGAKLKRSGFVGDAAFDVYEWDLRPCVLAAAAAAQIE